MRCGGLIATHGKTMISTQSLENHLAIGRAELGATDPDACVDLARALVRNPKRFAQASAGLEQWIRDSAETDVPQFARNLEVLYGH